MWPRNNHVIIFKNGVNDDAAEVNDPSMLPGSFLHEKEPGTRLEKRYKYMYLYV